MAHMAEGGIELAYMIALGFIVLLGIGFWWLYNRMKKGEKETS